MTKSSFDYGDELMIVMIFLFLFFQGFRKVKESEQWEYAHDDYFVKGKPELTHEIEKALMASLAPKTLADLEKSFKESPPDPSSFVDVDISSPAFFEKREAFLKALEEKKAFARRASSSLTIA